MADRTDSIFVSYRRDDSKHAAGRLVDRLAARFGPENLFLDVDSIALGQDFVEVLNAQVAKCRIMLVVIGPDWIDARDATGARRLEDPRDFVRIEVEAALNRDIRVIPVLIDNADPVSEEQLPDSLAPLARRQAIRLDHESFHVDVDRLADALSAFIAPPGQRPQGTGDGTQTAPGKRVITPDELHKEVTGRVAKPTQTKPTPTGTGDGRRHRWFDALTLFAIASPLLAFLAFGLTADAFGYMSNDIRNFGIGWLVIAYMVAVSAVIWLYRVSRPRARPSLLSILLGLAAMWLAVYWATDVVL